MAWYPWLYIYIHTGVAYPFTCEMYPSNNRFGSTDYVGFTIIYNTTNPPSNFVAGLLFTYRVMLIILIMMMICIVLLRISCYDSSCKHKVFILTIIQVMVPALAPTTPRPTVPPVLLLPQVHVTFAFDFKYLAVMILLFFVRVGFPDLRCTTESVRPKLVQFDLVPILQCLLPAGV